MTTTSTKRLPPTADYLSLVECRDVTRRFFHIMEQHARGNITGADAAQRLKDLHHEAQRWAQTS